MLLLDTHVLIWALMAPGLLSRRARAALDEASEWGLSAASLYEIRYKHAVGKWPEVESIVQGELGENLSELGFEVIPADANIMERAGAMKWSHRDPFDRILVTTAQTMRAAVVSKDRTLDSTPLEAFQRLW